MASASVAVVAAPAAPSSAEWSSPKSVTFEVTLVDLVRTNVDPTIGTVATFWYVASLKALGTPALKPSKTVAGRGDVLAAAPALAGVAGAAGSKSASLMAVDSLN